MNPGDLIRYKQAVLSCPGVASNKVYVVRRYEHENNWVFLYGEELPRQATLMEVISEARQFGKIQKQQLP